MLPKLETIKQLRLRMGISQRKLAELAGVSTSLINQIEAGRCKPSYETARRIFEVLNNLEARVSIKAGEIGSRSIVYIKPDEPIIKAAELMRKNGYSQLPVLENERAVGLITEEAIIKALTSGDPTWVGRMVVKQIMEPPPPLVDEATPAKALIPLIRYTKAVLIGNRGKITGIITASDLLKLVE
ncbi:MAG: CBS domain-containing protein [Nitrososphaerota archaeon]